MGEREQLDSWSDQEDEWPEVTVLTFDEAVAWARARAKVAV